jgi:hypothetical protein
VAGAGRRGALFTAGARRVLLPSTALRSSALAGLRGAGQPVAMVLQLFSIHLMGTARTGQDPRRA